MNMILSHSLICQLFNASSLKSTQYHSIIIKIISILYFKCIAMIYLNSYFSTFLMLMLKNNLMNYFLFF